MRVKIIFNTVLSYLFMAIMLMILSFLLFATSERNLFNFLSPQIIYTGVIVDFEVESSQSSGATVYFNNHIEILKSNNILKSQTRTMLNKGDTVKLRYVGTKENNIIFEVNGEVVGSKYDIWDYSSPFLMLFSGFLIYWLYLVKLIDRIKKKHFKIFIILFATVSTSYSQSFDIQCSGTPYLAFEASNFKTHKYEPVFMATKIYTNLSEVKNEFPEQLIESEMSVISQEWSSFFRGVGS